MILFRLNRRKLKQNKQRVQYKTMFEKEFVDIFIDDNAVKRLFGKDYIIVREFESASGIPDVLLLNSMHAERLLEFTNRYAGADLSQAHARIILNLNKRSYVTVDNLTQTTGYSHTYIRTILETLMCNDIVSSNDNGWKLDSAFKFPDVETISLEFKMSDWQSALKQGFRYKKLATRSYVIMPSDKGPLLKRNKDRFAGLDVGVVVYSHETKKAEIINKPSRSKPSNSSFLGSLFSLSSLIVVAT